jgi:hypothetical protein
MIRSFRITGVLIVFSMLSTLALGQLSPVTSPNDFDPSSVRLDFEGPSSGAPASQLLAGWGVIFPEGEWGVPVVNQSFFAGILNTFLVNQHPSGSSANQPLVINLRHPAQKIGFYMGSITSQDQVSIRAYDPVGQDLGEVSQTGLESPAFLGVETSSNRGIAKLLLSYGNAESAERIDFLLLEYRARPQFETYLAQVGDGPPGAGSLQTTIVVSNLTNSTAIGELAFFDEQGQPMQLLVNGTMGSTFDFSIKSFSGNSFATSATSQPVKVGWAKISSNVPVGGTAVFGILGADGSVETEAGVGTSEGSSYSIGAVQKSLEGNFDSGIAVVNISDQVATARIDALDQNGDLVAINNQLLANLQPGEHVARFLSQIFEDLADQNFDGTIRITGNTPLAAVILRTAKGKVLSSLPVGSTEE